MILILNRLALVAVACLTTFIAGCSGGSGGAAAPNSPLPPPPPVPAMIDFSFCDRQLPIGDGMACVIQPSKTDAAILDEHPDSATNPNTAPGTGEGFGFHVVSFPAALTLSTPVHVHLTGTYARPYDQNGMGYLADANGLHTTVLVEEAVAAGYLMIQLAYNNRTPVNDVCTDNRDTDNCAELVRRETLLGMDETPLTDTDRANSVDYRLVALLRYLEANLPAGTLAVDSSNVDGQGFFDWSNVRVGGHSQGAGHAWYIAKNFGTLHACMLGGPYDVADTVCPACGALIADWFQVDAAPGTYSRTTTSNLRGLLVANDTINDAVTLAYRVMNLTQDREWINLQSTGLTDRAGQPLSGHAAAAKADEFSPVRSKLCFTNEFLSPGEFAGL